MQPRRLAVFGNYFKFFETLADIYRINGHNASYPRGIRDFDRSEPDFAQGKKNFQPGKLPFVRAR